MHSSIASLRKRAMKMPHPGGEQIAEGAGAERHVFCTRVVGGEVVQKEQPNDREEAFEVNPDGADLDGTAELERQQAEREGGSGAAKSTTAPPVGRRAGPEKPN
jgi:hypothetical protein